MKMKRQTTLKTIASLTLAGGIGLMLLSSCQQQTPANPAGSTTQPKSMGIFSPPDRTGQQLWADNCMRCHNMRPPDEFSPKQWATIVTHMRLRANLTGEEARKITAFLQASS